jgi:hypothetical protein
MPFSMKTDPATGIVIATCSGSLGLGDARDGATALWENPQWSGQAVVWDFRDAQLDMSSGNVREIAKFVLDHQPASPPPRVAFVTGRDVDFGLVRMFEVFRAHPATEVRTFRDYDEAVSWASSSSRSSHSGSTRRSL